MKLKEWLDKNQEPDNLFMSEMEPGDAASIILDELFDGECISYSCTGKQALAEAIIAVIKRYGKH
jgi:hypothetical protein